MIVDAHVHIVDDKIKPFQGLILDSCKKNGIVLYANSTDLKSSIENLALMDRFGEVIKTFVGVHPMMAPVYNTESFTELVAEYSTAISGIGEIGLDGKYYNETPLSLQKSVFEFQLQIAEKNRLPISVHSRKAQNEVLDILETYSVRNVLLHWFSGEEVQMRRGTDLGCFFSYGPTLVYNKNVQRSFKRCNIDRVLLETDSPVTYGGCFGNKPASPFHIFSVLYKVCEMLRKPLEETLNMVSSNSENYIRRG